MQLQRGLSSVLRGAVLNFRQDLHFPVLRSAQLPFQKPGPEPYTAMGFPSVAAVIRPGTIHHSTSAETKVMMGWRRQGFQKTGTNKIQLNRSYLINPTILIIQCNWPLGLHWHIWTLFQPIPSSLALDHLIHHWAVPPPPPTAILGWTSSRCLVGKTCTCHCFNGSTKGRLCTKLCQAVLCSEIVMNSVFEMNIAGYRYSYLCIFMQHSPHHPCIYC